MKPWILLSLLLGPLSLSGAAYGYHPFEDTADYENHRHDHDPYERDPYEGDRPGDEDEGYYGDEYDEDYDDTPPPPREYRRTVVTLQFLAAGDDTEAGVGFGYYRYKPEGLGFFMNMQVGATYDEPYYDDLSIYSYGDPVRERFRNPVIINAGVTKSFGTFGVFGGLGYGGLIGVARKYDPTHILADDGEYFVSDEVNDKSQLNATAGGTVDLGAFSMDVGFNTTTSSIYMGIGANF